MKFNKQATRPLLKAKLPIMGCKKRNQTSLEKEETLTKHTSDSSTVVIWSRNLQLGTVTNSHTKMGLCYFILRCAQSAKMQRNEQTKNPGRDVVVKDWLRPPHPLLILHPAPPAHQSPSSLTHASSYSLPSAGAVGCCPCLLS